MTANSKPQEVRVETGTDEAVCFTAGPEGSAFGAGVIHAYIAADRKAPRVVAGISTGAITAAAFQRSMIERGPVAKRTEATRWDWFQRYLTDALDRPLDVIWKAFPDPTDFMSPTPPVRDLSCPPPLQREECEARYQFWLLTKLGSWMSHLTLSVGEIARLLVLKVRHDEGIPVPFLGRSGLAAIWRVATFAAAGYVIFLRVLGNVVLHPLFTRTREQFVYQDAQAAGRTPDDAPDGLGIRPLFGWATWLQACVLSIMLAVFFPLIIWLAIDRFHRPAWASAAVLIVVLCVALHICAALEIKRKPFSKRLNQVRKRMNDNGQLQPPQPSALVRLLAHAQDGAGIKLSLLNSYQLKRRLWNRFEDPKHCDRLLVKSNPEREQTSVVLVASMLQDAGSKNKQTWAQHGTPLIDALTAACAIPRLFAPLHIESKDIDHWLRTKDQTFLKTHGGANHGLDLIDGSVVRKNPLPALFNWLQENASIGTALESDSIADAHIHVIYNVPIEPFDAFNGKEPPDRVDVVDAAQVGLLMRARRDTSTEVLQTNYLSKINCATKAALRQRDGHPNGGTPLPASTESRGKSLAIFADEIAPERELQFANPLSPTREEALQLVAQGCRRTLGRLYRKEIEDFATHKASVECCALLRHIAPNRTSALHAGLPEVCANCTGQLRPYPQPPVNPDLVYQDLKQARIGALSELEKPRVAFVASGGVFRGAFHIGLLAAMQTLEITPDLVVGASVGTLMGAALANMRNADAQEQLAILAALTDTFLHVDDKVALTVPLKTAVKQLGLRARGIGLSLAELRQVVLSGTRNNVAYAATGVPPVLIDALSQLFIIPPRKTLAAGSDFVAGHFSKAAFALIVLMRNYTLETLGVRYAVIGSSLLEGAARELLGGMRSNVELARAQPYLPPDKKTGTAIFCTTAYINYRWPLLLGRDALAPGVLDSNFLYAALSSSAFPVAFSPRQESEVFPGTGRTTNLFCDGGTFDNLPLIPTIDLLSVAQRFAFDNQQKVNARAFLQRRLECPDLILCGGFDPAEEDVRRHEFTSQADVAARATSLGNSIKTESFIGVSQIQRRRLEELVGVAGSIGEEHPNNLDRRVRDVMTNSVVAQIINVVPSSQLHVNPTFGFARSVGFEEERVTASIADGCFQTLLNLRWGHDEELKGASLKARGIEVELRQQGDAPEKNGCPYFKVQCAFSAAAEELRSSTLPNGDTYSDADRLKNKREADGCDSVYNACKSDPVHLRLIDIERRKSTAGSTQHRLGPHPTQQARSGTGGGESMETGDQRTSVRIEIPGKAVH